MKQFARTLSIFSLCLHVISVGSANFGHDDVLGYFGDTERIATHECGAHEVHQGLESAHQCILCLRSAGSAAVLAAIPAELPGVCSKVTLHQSTSHPHSDLSTLSLQRGPPII